MSRITLGEFLRQEREKRGLTIEQVASATKINIRLLHSLEADQYSDLPAKPFVRGFVISYCRFVGIDHRELFSEFQGFLDNHCVDKDANETNHKGYAFEKKDTEKSRTILLAVMGSFVVLGAVVILVLKPALRHKKATHLDRLRAAHSKTVKPEPIALLSKEETKEEPAGSEAKKTSSGVTVAVNKAAPVPEKKTQPTNEKKASKAASADPQRIPSANDPMNKGDALGSNSIKHKVVFKAVADTWIRYKVDARSTMRFMLRKDKLLVLRGSEMIRFQTSNAKALSFRYQGGSYSAFADSQSARLFNQTQTIIFPPKSFEDGAEPFPGLSPLPKTPDPE